MQNERIVADNLLNVGAVKLSPEKPFTWASGWKSPIYCDNRKLLSHPFERDFIKSELCSVIFEKYPDIDAIAGVATAGIAWGALAADQLKYPFVYVRPKPKDHGLGNQIEGDFTEGQKILVVEDLVSTGKSSLEVCEVLRNAGANVVGMICLFTYSFPVAETAFKDAKVPLNALTKYEILVDLAVQKGIINESEVQTLLSWRENPSDWGNSL